MRQLAPNSVSRHAHLARVCLCCQVIAVRTESRVEHQNRSVAATHRDWDDQLRYHEGQTLRQTAEGRYLQESEQARRCGRGRNLRGAVDRLEREALGRRRGGGVEYVTL